MSASTGEPKFRSYTFFAGPLGKRQVRDISDEQLAWAIDYNQRYIAAHRDPFAVVRFGDRRVYAGELPEGTVSRRIGLAEEALYACEQERKWRATRKPVITVRPIGLPNVKEMMNQIQTNFANAVGAAKEASAEIRQARKREEAETFRASLVKETARETILTACVQLDALADDIELGANNLRLYSESIRTAMSKL